MASALMSQLETSIASVCDQLKIFNQTLYRRLAADGTDCAPSLALLEAEKK
jgi:hypothetical protein